MSLKIPYVEEERSTTIVVRMIDVRMPLLLES